MLPFLRTTRAPALAGPDRGTMLGYIEGTALPEVEAVAKMAEALEVSRPSEARSRRAKEIAQKAQALRDSVQFLKERTR